MTELAATAESTPFLLAFGGAMIATFIASIIIGYRLHATGRRHSVEDPAMLAWLAGGATRHADAIVTGLLVHRAIAIEGKSKLTAIDRSKAETATERRILALPGRFAFDTASRLAAKDAEPMLRQMVNLGLLADKQHLHRTRIAQVAPLIALFFAGALLWLAAWSDGRSALTLAFLLAMTTFMTIIRWSWLERRTQGGIDALDAAQKRHERLLRGAPLDELPLAVTLFGTGVLAGSALDAYHKLRTPIDSGGGDSGGSSDSGGGCGGGGCGGGD